MRLLIGIILALGLLFFALAAFVGGMAEWETRGMSDDVTAALVIAGLLFIAGVVTLWASIKAHRRRRAIKAGQKVAGIDSGAAQGTLMGIGMATMMNDDFGGDDGGGD